MYTKFWLFVLLSCTSLSVVAEPQVFRSGTERVGVIELYTSQGCSSCPPAERFLNSLQGEPGLWKDFIPMAFHVDYWNYLGWRDQFSKAEHSQRQRQYARVRNMATIYTPGFFVNGQEWRRRFYSRGLPELDKTKVGELTISVDKQQVKGQFVPVKGSTSGLQANVALLGMGLQTHIESGEREGSATQHEFVVLGHNQGSIKDGSLNLDLPSAAEQASNYAIVVWISQPGDPTPIQAVGGKL